MINRTSAHVAWMKYTSFMMLSMAMVSLNFCKPAKKRSILASSATSVSAHGTPAKPYVPMMLRIFSPDLRIWTYRTTK